MREISGWSPALVKQLGHPYPETIRNVEIGYPRTIAPAGDPKFVSSRGERKLHACAGAKLLEGKISELLGVAMVLNDGGCLSPCPTIQ